MEAGLAVVAILIAASIFAVRTIPTGHLVDIGQSTFISIGNLQDLGRLSGA